MILVSIFTAAIQPDCPLDCSIRKRFRQAACHLLGQAFYPLDVPEVLFLRRIQKLCRTVYKIRKSFILP